MLLCAPPAASRRFERQHDLAAEFVSEFQLGQSVVCRTMRPVLTSLGMEHFAIQNHDQVEFVVDGILSQAFTTQAPATIILSPLLTKRKV